MDQHAQLPTPSPEAAAASQALVALIKDTLVQQNGWMPFAQYMDLALYAPQYGYYTGGSAKIGTAGDFITAPTLSPLFGQTVAKELGHLLPQTAGNIYEFGAGTGDLAVSILKQLVQDQVTVAAYYIIEVSPELAQRQQQLVQAQCPEMAHKVHHLSALPDAFDGVLIGNEVLDAMACELIRWQPHGPEQQGVVWTDEGFKMASMPIAPDSPLFTAASAINPPLPARPYTSELHLAQQAFISTLGARLQRGGIIMIDYGFDEAQYYHPERSMGTLIGHYRHHTVHDPFFNPGLTDLTCHVNFTAMAQAGVDAQLDLIGYTTQANWLLNLGITDLLQQVGPTDGLDYIQATAACQKLLATHEMGELFKVIAFGKNIDFNWLGFTHGDYCHKL
ncbi:MAG: SAM-dependent methyltransferase [Neisseriaceae bacterium]|nr:SAM-dependent methyltransferase [Neisseriaceae bacterium]MBP6862239.1 SAM-dependent methyltransferase [Neisseriaceae bacterium]